MEIPWYLQHGSSVGVRAGLIYVVLSLRRRIKLNVELLRGPEHVYTVVAGVSFVGGDCGAKSRNSA
jgi:hypothetical protein